MNIQDFHTLVRDTAKRQSSLDTVIPHAVRQAARHIERNFTLQYMRRYQQFTLKETEQNIAFPSTRFKQISFMRYFDDGADPVYMKLKDPQELGRIETAGPTNFWLDGFRFIWFDNIADKDYLIQFGWIEYTNWPTGSGDEPWLLAHAEDVMLAATMIRLAPQMRDPDVQKMYSGIFDLGMKSLIDAELEFNASPSRQESMNYGKDME